MQQQYLSVNSLLDFSGKVVIVTGSGSGLGKGIARRFAEAGASVAVCYNNSEAGANELVAELTRLGELRESQKPVAKAFKANLTNQSDVKELVANIAQFFGSIDVLINNAGTYPVHNFLEMTLENWNDVMNANLTSAVLMTQAVAQWIKANGKGSPSELACSIVNISSIEAINPAQGHAHYNASKAGMDMLTKSNASELAQYGIRVNSVNPGVIEAPEIFEKWDGAQRYVNKAPLKRLGSPQDVADACLFFASPASRWITGTSLLLDGGMMTTTIY